MEAIEPLLMKLQICPHQLLFSMVAICFYLPVFDCVCVSVWRGGGGGGGKPLPPTHRAETWFFNAALAVFVLLFKCAGEQTLNRKYVLLSKYLRSGLYISMAQR